jgi:NAD(P)-dependent dehydrogenase (short-subunit alcohol dehydrogenase family)
LNRVTGGLEGKSILITGGGSGIGRACAAQLAADGAAVTIAGRTATKLTETVEQVSAGGSIANGGSIRFIVGDVTREDDVISMIAEASDGEGKLHACVANAGGGGMPARYADQDGDEFRRLLDLNVMGTFYCVKHSLPAMLKAGSGSFVAMSSLAGHITHRFFGGYGVAKAGIEAMMCNAADEYGAQNIRFNGIRPGFVSTEIMEGIPRDSDVYRSYIENTPMNGVAEPEDIGNLTRFLVGPESRWITGQIINVDGGHSLRRGPDFSSFVG